MSRSDARSTPLRQRHSRVVPATITAVILLAIGVLAAVAAISRLATGTWASQVSTPAGAVGGLTWGSAAVIATTAVVLVLGLVLLIAGIKPGAFTSTRLDSSTPGAAGERDFVISTRAMARLAAARADTVDGVEKVSVSASGRKVHLRVDTTSEQRDEIRQRVVSSVTDTLTSAGIQPPPRVSAAVRTKEI